MAACRLALIGGVLLFVAGLSFGYDRIPSVICWGIPSVMLVSALVFAELNGLTINHRLAKLGDSSYSLYLVHAILLNGIFYAASHLVSDLGPLQRLLLCASFSAACCLIAVVFFNLIERKLYRLRFVLAKPAPAT
jgi:peptidoglycan/LPS O-acetylase OafA/YrhL